MGGVNSLSPPPFQPVPLDDKSGICCASTCDGESTALKPMSKSTSELAVTSAFMVESRNLKLCDLRHHLANEQLERAQGLFERQRAEEQVAEQVVDLQFSGLSLD